MSLKKEITRGFIWTFIQQFGNYIVNFLVSLILARLLLPEEFGLVGMIAFFIAFGNVATNSGLSQSLIRTKDLDDKDYSTVFYFNLLVGIILYLLIFILAPLVAQFYQKNILIGILRLYGLVFIITGTSVVQLAILSRKMDFKTQTMVSLPSTIIGGTIGITLAYIGYGVWSLVWYSVSNAFFNSLQLWIHSGWAPSLDFSIRKLKFHFKFGYNITLSHILDLVFKNIYLVIIGKYFLPSQVGFYTRAEAVKQLPVNTISSTLKKVTYSAFSGIQDDNIRLKNAYRNLLKMVLYIISPVLAFIAVLGEPIFRFLFTEKWLPAVPYFQILCITGIFYPLHSYNLNLLQIKGRSDLVFKLAIVKLILAFIAIFFGLQLGIYGLLYGQVVLTIIFFFINTYYTERFISYSVWQQIMDIAPILILVAISGIFVKITDQFLNSQFDIIRIISGFGAGVACYLILSFTFRLKSFNELKKLIKHYKIFNFQ